jgi:hypothetical protein
MHAKVLTTRLFKLSENTSSLSQLIEKLDHSLGIACLGCFFVFQFGVRVFRYRDQAAYFRQAGKDVCRQYGTVDCLTGYLVVWFLLTPFWETVISFREMIPQIHAFTWDVWLKETTRLLHFGYSPWILLQSLLGYPLITVGIDMLYMLWLPLPTFFLLSFALSVRRRLRFHYILSFLLVWIILGTIGATIFSSVGPCFFAFVEPGENPYAPLLAYLDAVHQQYFLWSRYEQVRLWQAYVQAVPSSGITSMPSLHVAGATLFALGTGALNRRLGWLFLGYAVVIQLGSIHLAWHYALDGYISMIVTWIIWRLVGWGIAVTAWLPPDEEDTPVSSL